MNAGTRLGELESAAGIISPGLLLSFVLLAIFPLLAKWLLAYIKARRCLRRSGARAALIPT